METQSQRECAEHLLDVLFCCWCANIVFDKEGEKTKRSLCALSTIGMTYGSLTTALSAGACDAAKSSVCLGIGITGVVLGTCGCLCLCFENHPCVESSVGSEATNGSNEYPVLNQPI